MIRLAHVIALVALLSVLSTKAQAQTCYQKCQSSSGTAGMLLVMVAGIPAAYALGAFTVVAMVVDVVAAIAGAALPAAWGVFEIVAGSIEVIGAALILGFTADNNNSNASGIAEGIGIGAGVGALGAATLAHGIWTVMDGNRAPEEPDVMLTLSPAPGGLSAGLVVTF